MGSEMCIRDRSIVSCTLATALGWRGSFITVAIPTMLFGVVLYVILGRRGYRRGTTDEAATAAPTTVTQTRRLVTFTSLGVVLQVLTFSTLSFVPVFAVQDLGASEEAAASMLAVYHFAGLFAGPLGGYLSDRLGRVPVMLAVGLLAGPVMFLPVIPMRKFSRGEYITPMSRLQLLDSRRLAGSIKWLITSYQP